MLLFQCQLLLRKQLAAEGRELCSGAHNSRQHIEEFML
jgi:hypothetical protein